MSRWLLSLLILLQAGCADDPGADVVEVMDAAPLQEDAASVDDAGPVPDEGVGDVANDAAAEVTPETPAPVYTLATPWDSRALEDDTPLLSPCPPTEGLPVHIPDRLEDGSVDYAAWEPLSEVTHGVMLSLSDKAVAAGSRPAAACVLETLHYWAQRDAFIMATECEEGGEHWGHGYDRSNFITGVLAIPYLQLRGATDLDAAKRAEVQAWFEGLALCSRTRADGMLADWEFNGLGPHNQTYPALLAVATTALVLDRSEAFHWAIERYQEVIATVAEDGTAANEIAHKEGWTLHYHTLIENFSVHLALLGELNGVTGLFDDPALHRLTQLVLDAYDDPSYLQELTGFPQTQDPLTTPWNLSWVEHLKRHHSDPRIAALADQLQWQMDHSHTGGNPEYWWPEHWE